MLQLGSGGRAEDSPFPHTYTSASDTVERVHGTGHQAQRPGMFQLHKLSIKPGEGEHTPPDLGILTTVTRDP